MELRAGDALDFCVPASVLGLSRLELAREFDDIVVAVNVGNEALVDWNDHMVPVERMIAYVRRVKAAIGKDSTDQGLNGIAYPADGAIGYAAAKGLQPNFYEYCCSLTWAGEEGRAYREVSVELG